MTMSHDIPIELIDADPDQPRRHFDQEALQELADSLTANGQIVPITVRPVGERFVIVQGERRWRAAQLAGLPTLRAEVADLAPDAAYVLALIENIQRADLTPLEEASAYQRLIANGFNQTSLGKRIGKSQSYIAQKLRLLKLPAEVQTALADGTLTEGHARQLLRLDDADTVTTLAERAIANDWIVNRLWHEVTFTLLVVKPSRDHKFDDLIDYAKKLEPYESGGEYAEHYLRVERAVGKILHFGQRVWEEYAEPALAIGLLEDGSLADIQTAIDLERDLNRIGFDIRNTMELATLPKAESDDLIKRVIDKVDHDPDDDYWDRLGRELFTQAHAMAMQTMSHDIVVAEVAP